MKRFAEMSSRERLTAWRELRETLVGKDDVTVLETVSDFWGQAPIRAGRMVVDHREWNSPWEMIHQGDFDPAVVAVLMYHTLITVDPSWGDRATLVWTRDTVRHEEMLLLNIEPGFWLNYNVSEIATDNDIEFTSWVIQGRYVFDANKWREI